MRRTSVYWLGPLGTVAVTLILAGSGHAASTGVQVVVGGKTIAERITLTRHLRQAKFRLRAHGGDDVSRYCARFRFERFRNGHWFKVGGEVRDCIGQAPNPRVHYDSFLYPRKRRIRQLRRGDARLYASTSLGPSLFLRL